MTRLSARALVFNDQDELLLVKDQSDYWYTPGGRIEEKETSVEALIREIHEETGLQLEKPEFLFVHEYLRQEGDRSFSLWFLIRTKSELPSKWSDKGGPVEDVRFFSQADLPNVRPKFLEDLVWEWNKEEFTNVPKIITD